MSDTTGTAALPARRPGLVLRALPDVNQFVVKNADGAFYDLDEHSYFLLEHLDGQSSAAAICQAYEARFGEPLTAEELAGFVASARELGLLEGDVLAPGAEALS